MLENGQQLHRYHLSYGGECQGVGFRFTSIELARELGIVGWVRNEFDGTVTSELQGTSEQIETFLERIKTHFNNYNIFFTIDEMCEIPLVDEEKFEPKFY